MEWLINYFTLGLFIGSLCVMVQYNLFKPFVQLELTGWLLAVVLWPVAIVSTVTTIVRNRR